MVSSRRRLTIVRRTKRRQPCVPDHPLRKAARGLHQEDGDGAGALGAREVAGMRLGYAVIPCLLLLAVPGQTGETKGKRPRLDLRATPRFTSVSPSQVLVVAQLVGGDEIEEFYCPGLEWDW